MSIKIFGIIDLKDFSFPTIEQRIQKEIDLAFAITECAIKNKIGINMGGNIFSGFIKRYEWIPSQMPFELTDDPMDINADSLFIGDGINEYICAIDSEGNEISPCVREDIGENLLSRMSRVQNFLNELLKNEYVSKVTLDINALDILQEEVEIIEVSVNNFCEKMLELHKRENNWTPTVRVIVERN